jgi:hypothetical protein
MTVRPGILLLALLAVAAAAFAAPVAAQETAPAVVVLPDDVDTRGDWLGTYGSHAYVLCGMRSPESLYGGPGFADLAFDMCTGKPDDPARAWLSLMPSARNRTILWEPNGLGRTPASFDDHGEVYPLGQGPDLYVSLSVPEGVYLLSLYFFEIDWIQYRSYRIRIFSPPSQEAPIAETSVSDFYRGKYKRFAVCGPGDLRILIERDQSPNAIFSGLFLDELSVPDLYLFERTAEALPAPENEGNLDRAVAVARATHAALLASAEPEEARTGYLRCERDVFLAADGLSRSNPGEYCRRLDTVWEAMGARLQAAAGVLDAPGLNLDLRMLRYYAERAGCDFAACRRTMGELADDLLAAGSDAEDGWDWQSRYMREYALALMDEGRRGEAAPLLEAYVRYCLDQEPAEEARAELTEMGRLALTANVGLPVARGLSEWEERYGALPMRDRLLAGGLYYVSGRSEDAYRLLSAAEPEVYPEVRQRWCLVAMATSLLRMDRVQEAEDVLARLDTAYPGAVEADEIRYQFAVHYYRRRQLAEARQAFEALRSSAALPAYASLCDEYLVRVERLERLYAPSEKSNES